MPSILSTYSKEELVKKLKTQKKLLILKIGVIILLGVLAVISTYENGVSFNTFLPLFFIPMAIYMYMEYKRIKNELVKRK
ncbi:hypothetical protein [uncultured Polaribacter sp.]|uniref:hypothetical protein n=1 Tax=uncultured Polaribacter sp. TaxID=174711 RepID=UPI00261FB215|nr:hypothetical protein [uncultured Polaribacter sp.]